MRYGVGLWYIWIQTTLPNVATRKWNSGLALTFSQKVDELLLLEYDRVRNSGENNTVGAPIDVNAGHPPDIGLR